MTNIETVQRIYEAFEAGDVPAILERLDPSIDWEYGASTDVPWLQHRRGRHGVAAFFESLSGLDIHNFEVTSLFEGTRVVVALVNIEFTVKATGRRVTEYDEAHIWRFSGTGLVSRFRHRSDTFLQSEACRED